MNRRRVLSGSATALGSLFLAGCLDDDTASNELGDSDDSSGDDGTDGTNSSDGNESNADDGGDGAADRKIMRAVSRLNEVAFALGTIRDQLDDPTSVQFAADDERERLAAARDFLDEAETATDGDRQADVDALRAVADVLASVVDVTESLVGTDLEAELTAIRSAMAERRLEDAAATIRRRRADTEASLERLRSAAASLEGVDTDRLEALAVDVEPIRAGAAKLESVLESVAALVRGFEPITAGYEHLLAGETRLEEYEIDAAIESFEAARSTFDEAVSELEGGRESAPAMTAALFDPAVCRARTLREATTLFLEATEAAKERDRDTAESKREEAESTLLKAENCG